MTKDEFTRQLADLVGLEAGSDDLTAAHEKLAVAVQAPLYSEKILVAARKLASLRIHSDRFRDALSDAVYEGRALPSQRQDLARYFARDPEGAIALVRSLHAVRKVDTRARPPEGVDPARYDLDRRVQGVAVEHNIPYMTALDRVLEAA
jgi:hypothetical protein